MPKYILFFVVFIFAQFPAWLQAEQWNASKSTHFVVYYKNAPQKFIEEVKDKAEGYYQAITRELGFLRFDFWLWDNRASIYVYDNAQEYQEGTGRPAWSAGAAMPKDKVVYAFVSEDGFFNRTLPHEIGHIIFREFVGFSNPAVPLWIDEGVASYHGSMQKGGVDKFLETVHRSGRLIPLSEMALLDPQHIDESDTERVMIFYAESVSVINYLIRRFGKADFVSFCQALRDRRDFERALSYVYSLKNIRELDESWRKDQGYD
ncbi:MAG: peptidase MA family metallohydrolase [Candidatus Omnitrophica bacterium]|jgi:hypothetical protein|nr:peptidase MA family metallohydrolase [Candidatus Omnitrophota bacterium]MDD5078791.1 peptidase MA family metallohydrolase [Candidatus Omnitrophota bacterium]